MSGTAFERYAPFIQEYIYRKRWTDLREVQAEACSAILDTDDHVIIASGTASGKTEAAFFPILTTLYHHPSNSVGVLYIGPLKALINDQFERLSGLLEDSGIPVWPWHGDVSQSMKQHALKEAQGVLQITPESLEALLMLRSAEAARLFGDLRFVVIDEIHAFMGTDRGLQVLCLLSRLEKIAGCHPRRVGLSATLNDYEPALRYLAAGTNRHAQAVGIQHHGRTISLCSDSFLLPHDPEEAEKVMEEYNSFLYDNCHDKKCLIFTNSRASAEKVIADMKEIARKRQEKDVFFVHHGSISAALRQEAEAALRDRDGPTVAAATLTLELGIDIGDLDSTIQIGAPYSCTSFVQRLGRSGRRSGKSQMMFLELLEPSERNVFDQLPWTLLRAIAIIQLYLEESWVEPFTLKPKPFSLLAHQTLSTLMTYGELSPSELARSVLFLPAFRETITQEEYRLILRYMIAEDYLQRVENGAIIVGIRGERITNHYSFYAVFQDEQAYHVQSKEGEIGTLDSCPATGEVFVLAGRTWKTLDVDMERKIVYVAAGEKQPDSQLERKRRAYPHQDRSENEKSSGRRRLLSVPDTQGAKGSGSRPLYGKRVRYAGKQHPPVRGKLLLFLPMGRLKDNENHQVSSQLRTQGAASDLLRFWGRPLPADHKRLFRGRVVRRMAELSIDMDDPDMVLPGGSESHRWINTTP
jgi:ATP-dependent Lhr-like helicase